MASDTRSPFRQVSDAMLTDEICESILTMGTNKNENQVEIDAIKDRCSRQHASVNTLNLSLLQKYEEFRNSGVPNDAIVNRTPLPDLFAVPNVPLSGWSAVRASVFWLRFGAAMFAMISFIVMLKTYIGGRNFKPAHLFLSYDNMQDSCPYEYVNGAFQNSEYKFVTIIGIVVFVYDVIFLIYYLLPLNAQKEKYVPVVTDLLTSMWSKFTSAANEVVTISFSPALTKRCSIVYTSLEFLFDGVLFAVAVKFCIAASIRLEDFAEFQYYVQDSHFNRLRGVSYFTLESFFATFSNTDPPCIDRYHDPTPNIRASLAMMYLSVALLALNTLVSFRSFRVRRKLSQLESASIDTVPHEDPQSSQGLLAKEGGETEGSSSGVEYGEIEIPLR